ncbi:hypothetical protein Pmar_PMAR015922 [Perkinsus marinus ATCC 50983]|uniref:DM2 domain-containing protein n=1 Tax=Perkinsus marinus (strain ATCC 50983 / TXsc) TaxID=423536 RepID=C5L437_PERM5|nr:hypothetical protein Pmar_PMAR015922 [Perkinsus marinus ATCC 50983]EER08503.1 hypothetical protein Pmar_PMAR015922 [Perkinsus marinus ATCC 50983]|eukprot:XP_002776687.1 hypothetical protein Pmar_PMAR015922 [Perkinsus marinus ATCC 50983]
MSTPQTIYTVTSQGLRRIIGNSECTLSHLYTSIWGYARLHGLKRPRGTFQTDDQLAVVFGRRGIIHYDELPALISPLISLGRAPVQNKTIEQTDCEVRRPKLYIPNAELKAVLETNRQEEICTFEEAVNGVKNYAIAKGLILEVHPVFIVTDQTLRPLFPMASVPLGLVGNFIWYALTPSTITTTDFPKEYFNPQTAAMRPNSALARIVGEAPQFPQELLLEVAAYVLRNGLQRDGRVWVDDKLAALDPTWHCGSTISKLNLFRRVVGNTTNVETDVVQLPRHHPLRRETALSKIFEVGRSEHRAYD